VRREPVVTDRVWTIPNALSALRLLLVPVFAVLILTEHDAAAIVVLMVSGFTDYLDGKLARRFGQVSRLGQLLDPAADRLYILVTLLGLAYRDVVPWWLVAALVLRDAVLTATLPVLASHGHGPLEVTYLGKAATFNLLYAFPLLLLAQGDSAWAQVALPFAYAFTAWGGALYLWSALLYVYQFFLALRVTPDRAA
jgi:cardiolipin synthase